MIEHPPHLPRSSGNWCIEIYRVSNQNRQECILGAFDEIRRPDVTALGSQSGQDRFVIVELMKPAARIHALRVIVTIDPHAELTYSTLAPEPARSRRRSS